MSSTVGKPWGHSVGSSKWSRKKVVILILALVVIVCAAIGFVIFSSRNKVNMDFTSEYDHATVAIAKGDFEGAQKTLDNLQKNDDAKQSYKFYSQWALVAYELGDVEVAKERAKVGLELYDKANSSSKESSFGILLDNINTDLYVPKNYQEKVQEGTDNDNDEVLQG